MRDRKYISFMEESDMSPILRPDFKLPLLQKFLNYQGYHLTIWEDFVRTPTMSEHEKFICILDGVE